jgi:hypothetical protein
MGYNNGDDASLSVLLFDWVSSCNLGDRPVFCGNLHYAAQDVLEKIANFEDIDALAEYDLESLVYSYWEITSPASERPRPMQIGMIDQSVSQSMIALSQHVRRIQEARQAEEGSKPLLRRLLSHARAR